MKLKMRILTFILVLTICLSVLPTNALAAAEAPKDIRETEVTLSINDFYEVQIPKKIILDPDTKSSDYNIRISGNIAGTNEIAVIPEDSFVMTQNGKSDITAIVTQTKQSATSQELERNEFVNLSGNISAPNATSGDWVGSLDFLVETWHYNPFVLTAQNAYEIGFNYGEYGDYGYSNCDETLVIPEKFTNENGTTYKVIAIGEVFNPDEISEEEFQEKIQTIPVVECTNLKSVNIPDGVISIGTFAFTACTSLTEVTIPASVTLIDNSAFTECASLTAINVAPNNPAYCSVDGVVFTKDMKTLVLCPSGKTGTYTIPEGVTYVMPNAFIDCGVTSVKIPSTMTTINEAAFKGCSSLENMTIPTTVNSIDIYAFTNCVNLTNITIEDNSQLTAINEYAFQNCTSLQNISFGNESHLKTIGWNAFTYCEKLQNVNIPASVVTIENYAFSNCYALQNITFENGIQLDEINYGVFYGSGLVNITIPSSVLCLDQWSFRNCQSLVSIEIPNSVTSINYGAFTNCAALTDITFNGTQSEWNAISKGTSWNSSTGNYTIHCTDGDIQKS